MPRIAAASIACALAVAGVIGWLTGPASATNPDESVWCHDTARDLVTRRPADTCRGRIVNDAEADRVRERRRTRIRRSLGGVKSAVPRGRMGGSGTGFFIARDGTLVTNAHVIEGCKSIVVEAADNDRGSARVLGVDTRNDLALLRADIVPKDVADFASLREPEFDEPVAIVGFPLHGRVAIKPILVTGHVLDNARARRGHASRFRMRADVRRGNSGGPVLDGQGLVIGVVAAKVHTPRTFRVTGRLVRNVGVAIAPGSVFSFLEAQNQPHRRSVDGVPMSDAEIMARARLFVVRLVCWR